MLLVIGAAAIWWIARARSQTDVDFRTLGYVTLVAAPSLNTGSEGNAMRISATIYVQVTERSVRDIKLITAIRQSNGTMQSTDRSSLLHPQHSGSPDVIEFATDAATTQMTTCLVLPDPKRGQSYRITQLFKIEKMHPTASDEAILISPIDAPKVAVESAAPCDFTS